MDSSFDKAPAFYFSCTEDGKLININETACNALDYTKQELTEEKIDIIFTIATRIFYQTHLLPMIKMQGCAKEIFISLQTKNKEDTVLIHLWGSLHQKLASCDWGNGSILLFTRSRTV